MQDQKPLPPLHRLPNGTHVDPRRIAAITPLAADNPDRYCLGTRVSVATYDGVSYFLPFASFADAQAYADELAAVVNAARRGAHESRDEPPLGDTWEFGE